MPPPYVEQWTESGTPNKKGKIPKYTVSLNRNNTWECSCANWCTTVPREDCKHIGRRIKKLIQEGSDYVNYLMTKQVVTTTVTKVSTVHSEETRRTIMFGDV